MSVASECRKIVIIMLLIRKIKIPLMKSEFYRGGGMIVLGYSYGPYKFYQDIGVSPLWGGGIIS